MINGRDYASFDDSSGTYVPKYFGLEEHVNLLPTENVPSGTKAYCVDSTNSYVFLAYTKSWYLYPEGGGGGSVTPAQIEAAVKAYMENNPKAVEDAVVEYLKKNPVEPADIPAEDIKTLFNKTQTQP